MRKNLDISSSERINFNLEPDSKILLVGKNGLVGSAIRNELIFQGFDNIVSPSHSELDLTDRIKTFNFLNEIRPDVVIDAAAMVGGIVANSTYPADFISQNLQIQVNLFDAANDAEVNRLLFLGSSCIYPKHSTQPIQEKSLLTGPLEESNIAYAIAKISGVIQVQSIRKQFGRSWISAMPTNLYGPGDNFHPQKSHVVPGLIRRFHEAKESNANEVHVWGTGLPRRELLHSSDLAKACVYLLRYYNDPEPINIGVGKDISIHELALLIASIVGFKGSIVQDSTKPDGTPQKLLDVKKINELGWQAEVSLQEGLEGLYKWYLENEL